MATEDPSEISERARAFRVHSGSMKFSWAVIGGLLVTLGSGGCGTEDRSFVPDDTFARDDGGADASTGGGGGAHGGSCQGVVCDTPPAPICANPETRRVFSAGGTCENGVCVYPSADARCVSGCEDGQCAGDTCVGVTCDTPPGATCADESTLRSFESRGSCSGGDCAYAPVDTPCGFGCEDGACKPDPCIGVACESPPAAVCLDGTRRRSYVSPGTCERGDCTYSKLDSTCQDGCANGACKGDPCAGVVCDVAPSAVCLDGTTLRRYASTGTCQGGDCSFDSSTMSCVFGCEKGACKPDPCETVTCSSPPASNCKDAYTQVAFGSGACSDGSCTYSPTLTTCPFGCEAGRCKPDPCAEIACEAPPPATCDDANTRRSYRNPGTCAGGGCTYDPIVTTCPFGCAGGTCDGDPCAGVTCSAPPAAKCVGGVLRSYDASGTCANGDCSYGYHDTTCEFGCENAACKPDPCEGLTCSLTPAPICATRTTRRVYESPGTCVDGACEFSWTDSSCAYQCENGQCIPDPCASARCGDGVCNCGENGLVCPSDCAGVKCPRALSLGTWESSDDGWKSNGPFWTRGAGQMTGGLHSSLLTKSYSIPLTYENDVNLASCASASWSFELKFTDLSAMLTDVDKSERLYAQCSGDSGSTWTTLSPNPWPANQSECLTSYCDGNSTKNRSFDWTAQTLTLPAACRTAKARFRFWATGSNLNWIGAPGWYLRKVVVN